MHGTVRGYRWKCRCEPCKNAYKNYRRATASKALAAVVLVGACAAPQTAQSRPSDGDQAVTDWATPSAGRRLVAPASRSRSAAARVNAHPNTSGEGSPRPRRAGRGTPARAAALNWAALRQCESSGNYQAVSPSGRYRGAYQFSRGTWASVGGTGDPAAASPAEQDKRARLLYAARGAQPWPECGRHLR